VTTTEPSERALVVRAGRIVVGDGTVLRDGWVTVADGRVRAVASEEPAAAAGRRIDAPDATLLPGLIDCHVHLCLDGGLDLSAAVAEPYATTVLRAAARARATLAAGFTTIRTLGGRDGVELALRDAQAAGELTAPRIRSANRIICTSGGHGSGLWGIEVDGPDDARAAARAQLAAGADWLKVTATGGILTQTSTPGQPELDVASIRAIVEEAGALDRGVASHVLGREGLAASVAAGVRSIEHGVGLDEELARAMVDGDVALVATRSCALDVPLDAYPEWSREAAAAINARHVESFALARRAGVPLALGTDCGVPGFPHGENARELVALVREGLTPVEALTVATTASARLLGLEHELGAIAAGKRADLVLCPGDASADVGLLLTRRDELTVIQDGLVRFSPHIRPRS
jgi:imidazolonepropionase-like amidohydrolase